MGENAVVAAGAVVTKDVEANTVVGGNPANRKEMSEKETDPAPAEGTEFSDRTEKEEMDTDSDNKVEGTVIYVDPYAGDDYELSADLILVTHPHYDHNMVDKVQNRNPCCEIITQAEAIQNGEHQLFERGCVTVEAVEAGYNSLHDVGGCVGYILTFSDGKSVYV